MLVVRLSTRRDQRSRRADRSGDVIGALRFAGANRPLPLLNPTVSHENSSRSSEERQRRDLVRHRALPVTNDTDDQLTVTTADEEC